jgi:hypothetical protein
MLSWLRALHCDPAHCPFYNAATLELCHFNGSQNNVGNYGPIEMELAVMLSGYLNSMLVMRSFETVPYGVLTQVVVRTEDKEAFDALLASMQESME